MWNNFTQKAEPVQTRPQAGSVEIAMTNYHFNLPNYGSNGIENIRTL